MAAEPKPKTRPIWSEGGEVSEPADAKKSLGWVVEIPPHETFNWILNNLAAFATHVNESGIPEWDTLTSYDIDALAKGSDGTVYVSLTNGNAANDPVSTPTDWSPAWAPATFAARSVSVVNDFPAESLPHLKLLLDSSPGPFTVRGVGYTHEQLTTIYNNLLSLWITEMET